MPLESLYKSASGRSQKDCAFIGHRFDSDVGFRPGEIESWILTNNPDPNDAEGTKGVTSVQYGAARWYTALWRSPSGAVYVSDGDGEVHTNPGLASPDSHLLWKRHPLQASLFGIFGLDDENVWTWGQRRATTGVMFRWNRQQWSEMLAPDFEVVHVHGKSPDLLFAVGRSGGIAQWDGTAWRRWSCPVSENLNSVWVGSEDEIYATGDAGSLLEGSKHGWAKIAQGPGPGTPLLGVGKWMDQLWVAAGPFGLLRRIGHSDRLESIKDKLRASSFDTRSDLLITADDTIGGTPDGVAFKGVGRDSLLKIRQGKALLDIS